VWWRMVYDKDGAAKDGVWQNCVRKMVCQGWCVKDGLWRCTKDGVWQRSGVKNSVWQNGVKDGVSKMICDKVVWQMVC
jgi:hypothetical protein